jgi:hypothetical protein
MWEGYPAGPKETILGRIREIRGGRLNDPNFKSRMRAEGPYADHMRHLFEVSCRKNGLSFTKPKLNTDSFRRPGPAQLGLF